MDGAAKMVLNDFLRGKLPWFTPPPVLEGGREEKGIEGRQGALGEMKRGGKREVEDSTMAEELAEGDEKRDGDFEGFDGEDDELMDPSDEELSLLTRRDAMDANLTDGEVALKTG